MYVFKFKINFFHEPFYFYIYNIHEHLTILCYHYTFISANGWSCKADFSNHSCVCVIGTKIRTPKRCESLRFFSTSCWGWFYVQDCSLKTFFFGPIPEENLSIKKAHKLKFL